MGLTIQEFLIDTLLPAYDTNDTPAPGSSPDAARLSDPAPTTRKWKAGMKAPCKGHGI